MTQLLSLLFFTLIIAVILLLGAYLFWFVRFKKAPRSKIPALVYHKIANRLEWGITRQKVEQFERQMRYLKEQGYRPVRMEEAFEERDSEDSKEILITFDDGYESVYTSAFPILQRYGFTACIFLITGYVGKLNDWDVNWGKKFRHISWNQVKEMQRYGFSFGSHTVNHPDLTKLEKRFVEYELKRSRETLEDKLSQKADSLSFPFGRYNQMVEQSALDTGYRKAFTICPSRGNADSHSLVQGRLGMYLFDSSLTLKMKLDGKRLFWIEDLKGRIINAFASGTALVKKPDYRGAESRSITIPG